MSGSRCWYPDRDPEPGPEVLAVAVAGTAPSWRRWERTPEGWSFRGVEARHARYTPARRWYQVGDRLRPGERPERPLRPVVDVTGELGELCPACEGYGCYAGCYWSGRRDWPARRPHDRVT